MVMDHDELELLLKVYKVKKADLARRLGISNVTLSPSFFRKKKSLRNQTVLAYAILYVLETFYAANRDQNFSDSAGQAKERVRLATAKRPLNLDKPNRLNPSNCGEKV